MSDLQKSILQSIQQNNVDLMLPVILRTKFFMVCHRDDEAADPEIFLTPSVNKDQLCVTVSEDASLLDSVGDDDDNIVIAEIDGDQLLGVVAEAHEIMIVFEEGGYCIPRDHIEWWYADEPEEEADETESD